MGWTNCVARIGEVRREGGKTEQISSLFKPLVGKKEPYYKMEQHSGSVLRLHSLHRESWHIDNLD
jgi:hypothetical protein